MPSTTASERLANCDRAFREAWDRAAQAEAERDALREALERIEGNAEAWHGDNEAKARALAVIAEWCRAALTGTA